jgi:drug/metabolite transporter (DMT)-like permease
VSRRSWTWLLLLASIWGASYLLIKIGLRDLSPAMIAWMRIALAAAVLVPVAASQRALGPAASRPGTVAVVGAAQVAGPFLLIGLGEQEISSALAGILVATAAIFTAVLAIWVDHEERSEGARLLGIVIGIAGVVALFGLDLSSSGSAVLGGLAVVLASLGYAVGGFLVKHRLRHAPPIGVAAWVMVAGTIWLLPAALITAPGSVPDLGPLAAVTALGVVGTGLAFAIFYTMIGRVGPARSFIVSYLAPGFAVVYGALLLDEQITAAIVAGLVLILAGSWLAVEGAPPIRWRRAEATAPPDSAPRPAPTGARQGR